MMEKNMKKICKMLEGKFDSEANICNLKLKDIAYKDGYLYIDFDKSSLTVNSWDSETDLPNFLNIDIVSKAKRRFDIQNLIEEK